MKATVTIAGQSRVVHARREGDVWLVTIDGRELEVDAKHLRSSASILFRPRTAANGSATNSAAWRSAEVGNILQRLRKA